MAMRFKVLVSQHEEADGSRYGKGEVVTTDMNLVEKFGRKKFKRLKDVPDEVEDLSDEADEDEEEFEDSDFEDDDEDGDEEEDQDGDEAHAGIDVTAEFKVTDEALKVWQFDGGYYNITRDDVPAHSGKIRKTKVVQLLKELQKKKK